MGIGLGLVEGVAILVEWVRCGRLKLVNAILKNALLNVPKYIFSLGI